MVIKKVPKTEPRVISAICSDLALCHICLNQNYQAVQKALQATEEDSTDGVAWHQLGMAHRSLKQYDEVVTCHEKAVEVGMPAKFEQLARDCLKGNPLPSPRPCPSRSPRRHPPSRRRPAPAAARWPSRTPPSSCAATVAATRRRS